MVLGCCILPRVLRLRARQTVIGLQTAVNDANEEAVAEGGEDEVEDGSGDKGDGGSGGPRSDPFGDLDVLEVSALDEVCLFGVSVVAVTVVGIMAVVVAWWWFCVALQYAGSEQSDRSI